MFTIFIQFQVQEIPPVKQVSIQPPSYQKSEQDALAAVAAAAVAKPTQAPVPAKSHRRMSSIGQSAIITDMLQTAASDQIEEPEKRDRGMAEKRSMSEQQSQQPVLKKQMTFDAAMIAREETMDDAMEVDYDMSTAERKRLS